MRLLSLLLLAALLLMVGTAMAQVTGDEPIVGGPCEGCEAVFQGLPDELTSSTRLAPLRISPPPVMSCR